MYALDVECVATGKTHNDRAVAQIGLVDAYGRCVLNVYVKPKKEVVSYLTPLTGLTAALIDERGVPLEEAIRVLRSSTPFIRRLSGYKYRPGREMARTHGAGRLRSARGFSSFFRAWDARATSTSRKTTARRSGWELSDLQMSPTTPSGMLPCPWLC